MKFNYNFQGIFIPVISNPEALRVVRNPLNINTQIIRKRFLSSFGMTQTKMEGIN